MMNLMEHCRAAGHTKAFSRKKNEEVYQRLIAGDGKARDEMILGNAALVVLRVDHYLRRNPKMAHMREDMISAGVSGLCAAVDRMQKGTRAKKINPTGYIYTAIDQRIDKLLDEESTIVIPHASQEAARKKDQPITPPRTIGGNAAETLCAKRFAVDLFAGPELEEEIRACCLDRKDLRIVQMRIEGYNDREIGEALGMAENTVTVRRGKLYERLTERCPEYADD